MPEKLTQELRSGLATLVLVVMVSAAGAVGGLIAAPTQALATHPAGAGCPHEHVTRTSSECRPGVGPRTTCQGTGTCQQQVQCNCTFSSATAAGTAALDARINFDAVSAANEVDRSLACTKMFALLPLILGWTDALAGYSLELCSIGPSTEAAPTGATMSYVSSEFLRDVDTTLKNLIALQLLSCVTGSSALSSGLSELQLALLSAQICHLSAIQSQVVF